MHVPSARLLFRFTIILIVLAAAGVAVAGPLSGRVVDPDGRPVAGARVFVTGSGASAAAAITTHDGRFTITVPDTGRVAVRVAADGFKADPLWVDAPGDAKDLGTISLSISARSES